MIDEEFLKDHLTVIRDLASRADPFIKRRLVALAEKYELRLRATRAANVQHPVGSGQ